MSNAAAGLERPAPRARVLAGMSLALTLAGCRLGPPPASAAESGPPPVPSAAERAEARHEVERTLDAFHAAAARADLEGTFAQLATDARFLGTDAREHWDVAQFRAYCEPHFARGRGWTYRPRDRWIALDERLEFACFDERLDNEAYGELRGTGALRREHGRWRIAHYSMSFPVPNELTRELVERIRAEASGADDARDEAR
jgi:hypothetical protein